ncbi:MAG TPA: cytochrome c [Anaerolineales bacterium]|nr:cytochrome c [Anaerolineales bacterium]
MKFKLLIVIFSAITLAACSGVGGSGPTLTPVEQQGQAVYTLRCAQCHALTPDTVVIGPSLAGIATRAGSRVPVYDTQTYLETSILIPEDYLVEGFANTMPTNFGKELTSEEFTALVAYLMTLK